MKKNEWIYREILYRVLEKKEHFLKQRDISKKCKTSIGNVHKSLKQLESMNAIEKKPMGFRVINPKKILLYWASIRNMEKDIVFGMSVPKTVQEIEKELPPVIFTAYSGYKFRFREVPADYSEVIVYGDKEMIRRRFKSVQGKHNLIVLKLDQHLKSFRQIPVAQLFVDLWNLNTWYADDFVKALEKRIDKMLR